MSLSGLLIIWAVITVVLIVLLIYRSTLSIKEDNQLFLTDSESHMQKEQQQVLSRLESLRWPVRVLGSASGLLILVIFGIWLWQGLNKM